MLTVQAYACTTHKCNAQKNAVMLAALYQMVYLNQRKCIDQLCSELDQLRSVLGKFRSLTTLGQQPFRFSSQATLNLNLNLPVVILKINPCSSSSSLRNQVALTGEQRESEGHFFYPRKKHQNMPASRELFLILTCSRRATTRPCRKRS